MPYRAIHDGLTREPRFLALTPEARHLFYALKINLGASGIDAKMIAEMALWTGYSTAAIRAALDDLAARRWVRFDEIHDGLVMVWIIEGLDNDPNLSLSNSKHVESIARHVEGLSKSFLVKEFCDRYGLPVPRRFEGLDSHPVGYRKPIDSLSLRDKGEGIGKGKGNRERESLALEIETGAVDPVQAILDECNAITGRSLSLTPLRKRKIRDRLREGFTPEQLADAMRGAFGDPYFRGEDPKTSGRRYDQPETVFRDAGCVERHLEHWQRLLDGKATARPLTSAQRKVVDNAIAIETWRQRQGGEG